MNVVRTDNQQRSISALSNDPATDEEMQKFSRIVDSILDEDFIIDFTALDTSPCMSVEKDRKVYSDDKFRCAEKRRFQFKALAKQLKTKCLPSSPKLDLDEDNTLSTVASSTSFAPIFANEHQDETEATTEPAVSDVSSASYATVPGSKRRVRFGHLVIHSHEIELGGSALPGSGPAVSLGWQAESHVTIESVEAYDDARPCLPRKGIEMQLPKKYRMNLLLDRGYTLNQIRQCTQEDEAIRRSRIRTVQQFFFAKKTKSKLRKLAVWKKRTAEVSE